MRPAAPTPNAKDGRDQNEAPASFTSHPHNNHLNNQQDFYYQQQHIMMATSSFPTHPNLVTSTWLVNKITRSSTITITIMSNPIFRVSLIQDPTMNRTTRAKPFERKCFMVLSG
jgi:hypothetical protein